MSRNIKLYASVSVLVAASAIASAAWSSDKTYFVNQPQGIDVSLRNVDFATASVPLGSGPTAGRKVWDLDLSTNNGTSQCFEIATSGDGTGDTRLWVADQSLDDDSGDGLYSSARVWLVPTPGNYEYLTVTVAAYSSAYNSIKFSLDIRKRPGLTEAQCVGQGPAVKSIQGTRTFVNAN